MGTAAADLSDGELVSEHAGPSLGEQLEEMRAAIVHSSPWSRSGHAWYRTAFPDVAANRVINGVAVVEGLARCLVAQRLTTSSVDRDQAYARIRKNSVTSLLLSIAKDERTTANGLFGSQLWADFRWAVEYRNFLVHEGALLSDMLVAERLLDAAEAMLTTIRAVGRGRGLRAYGRPRLRR